MILFFLLFISFLSIGIGYGSKKYLENKLKDPFITFIDITNPTIPIPGKKELQSHDFSKKWCWFRDSIEKSHIRQVMINKVDTSKNSEDQSVYDTTPVYTCVYGDDCAKDTIGTWGEYFNFEGPFPQKYTSQEFVNSGWYRGQKKVDSLDLFKMAIIDSSDVFYKKLKKIPKGEEFSRLSSEKINLPTKAFGCIVTEKFLADLGLQGLEVEYSNLVETPFYVEYSPATNDSTKQFYIPIKIEGVVTELRNKVDILISDYVYWAMVSISDFNFHTSTPKYLTYFVVDGNINTFETSSTWTTLRKRGFKIVQSFRNGSGIIRLTHNIDLEKDLGLITQFQNENPSISMLRIFDIENNYESATREFRKEKKDPQQDKYTISLGALDGASNLAHMLEFIYGIEIDKTVIENKKNFSFFGNMITILSVSLIFFSIMSIIFFITNLLLTHIENNKKSLGTLKAFGLSSSSIVFTYSTITFAIVLLCFVFSYGLSEVFGDVVLNLFSKLINDTSGYLQLVEFSGLPVWLNLTFFIVVPTVWVCLKIYRYLYKITPGDLIYNRKQ